MAFHKDIGPCLAGIRIAFQSVARHNQCRIIDYIIFIQDRDVFIKIAEIIGLTLLFQVGCAFIAPKFFLLLLLFRLTGIRIIIQSEAGLNQCRIFVFIKFYGDRAVFKKFAGIIRLVQFLQADNALHAFLLDLEIAFAGHAGLIGQHRSAQRQAANQHQRSQPFHILLHQSQTPFA